MGTLLTLRVVQVVWSKEITKSPTVTMLFKGRKKSHSQSWILDGPTGAADLEGFRKLAESELGTSGVDWTKSASQCLDDLLGQRYEGIINNNQFIPCCGLGLIARRKKNETIGGIQP